MQSFFGEDVIVPGGVELGVYPGVVLAAPASTAIERVVRACVARHADRARRLPGAAVVVLPERLGSYLLLKRLRAGGRVGSG